MKPVVSVVIPVYNGQASLGFLLEALFDSSSPDYEVLVVDNGSTDDTAGIAARYPVSYYYWDSRRGPGPARNYGAARAQGDYLLFVDSDCRIESGYVAKCLTVFKQMQEKYCNMAALSGQVLPQSSGFSDRLSAWVEHWEYLGGKAEARAKLSTSNCFLSKDSFDTAGGFDERLLVDEDRELGLRLFRDGYGVYYTPDLAIRHAHGRSGFWSIIAHQYHWGRLSGMINEWKYRRDRNFWFLAWIKTPWVYLLVIPILCLILTLRIVKRNGQDAPLVLLYSPFIYMAKLAYRLGVAVWLFKSEGWEESA